MKSRFEHPDGGHANSDAIRSDIAHTREQMDHTLDEISRRMTPRHLLDEVLDFFRSHRPDRDQVKQKAGAAMEKAGDTVSEVTHAVSDVVRRHPVPTLLIGAGIAWAVYESRRGERYGPPAQFAAGDYEGESMEGRISGAVEGAQEGASAAKQKFREGMESMKEKGRDLRERAADAGHAVREKAEHWKEDAQRKFTETSDAHPLSVGLGFLALGVLAGLAVPATRKEDEWLGEMSERVKGGVKAKGHDLVERGRQVGTAAVHAAKEKAAKEGMTPAALKEKVERVATEAKGAAENAAHQPAGQSPQERPASTLPAAPSSPLRGNPLS